MNVREKNYIFFTLAELISRLGLRYFENRNIAQTLNGD